MSRDELTDRCRQELFKRIDTGLAACGYNFAAQNGTVPTGGKFFFDSAAVPVVLDAISRNLPQQAGAIVAEAQCCCSHRFNLLGYRGIDYGREIDWHLDAVNAKRSPRLAFYKVPYLDFDRCGDVKVTWELNRHQHFTTLAKAYRITGDVCFIEEIRSQFASWQAANPYPTGVNWASSLEIAVRSLSWLWTYFLLEGVPDTQDLRSALRRGLGLNARHIERYLSTYFSPNSHLLGEGLALFFIGTICTEFAAAPRWCTTGWRIVLQEAPRQVRAGGMHFEQSTYYHVYHIDFMLHAVLLARANGIAVPPALERTLLDALEVLSLLARGGTVPKFGDEDGGRLFDPRRNSSDCMSDPLSTGALLFGRGDFKAAAGELREETLWLLGASAVDAWERIRAAAPEPQSFALKSSGIYALAAQHGELITDGGPHGALHGGHGHADALSICLRADGKDLLIDPGTGAYTGALREMFRGTAMHNTLQVDGRSQADTSGAFKWSSQPDARAVVWSQQGFDLFAATHEGYLRLARPVRHTRWIFSARAGFWLVRDVVDGTGEHDLALHWHLAPQLQPLNGNASKFVAEDGAGLALFCASDKPADARVLRGVWSPVYGAIEPAWVLQYRSITMLPAEFCTLLVPISAAQQTAGTIDPDVSGGVSAYRYRILSEEYRIYFGVLPEWTAGDCSSDARFLCRRISAGYDELMSFGGTWARIAGDMLPLTDGRVRVARRNSAARAAEGSLEQPLPG
jgi:hypothetical protein